MVSPESALLPKRIPNQVHGNTSRPSRAIAAILALLLVLGSSQPVVAGCCDDAISCAGAIATGGLTCTVEGLINTVNNLIARVKDLRTHIVTLFQAEAHDAQQGVNDAADELTQANQAAIAEGKKEVARAEQVISEEKSHTYVHSSQQARESQHTKTTEAGKKPSSKKTSKSSSKSSGASSSTSSRVSGSKTTKKKASSQGVSTSAHSSRSSQSQQESDILRMLEKARIAIAERLSDCEKANAAAIKKAAEARLQAETGVAGAVKIVSNVALSPLDGLLKYLQGLIAHPDNILDPTAPIDAELNSVVSALDSAMNQVAKAVTDQAETSLRSAAKDSEEIAALKKEIAAIEVEMEKVVHFRSATSLDHLARLIQPTSHGSATLTATSSRHATGHFAEKILSARQRAMAAPKQRIEQFKQDMAQLKTMHTQARTARASLPDYQKNLSRHLDQYFAGKSSAEAAKQRDQLIAEARTRFAKDERTRNAVIELLTRESNKRIPQSSKVRS